MNINKSKVTLAAKIKSSGFEWPQFGKWAAQDKDGEIFISGGDFTPVRMSGEVNWEFDAPYKSAGKVEVGLNWSQCTLSREEYFHLYPAPGADGWIEWNGGECPVGRGVIVDIKDADGYEWIGVKALDCIECDHDFWAHTSANSENNIIAYRLHKPEQSKQEFCESVTRSIPEYEIHSKNIYITQVGDINVVESKPTIEQLAADYRAKLAIATQAKEEADSHRCGAEVALSKLEIAAKELGFKIEPIAAKQEPELVASKFTGKFHSAKHGNQPISLDMVCDGCGKRLGHHVGFECRP